jgi:hypothetical protein
MESIEQSKKKITSLNKHCWQWYTDKSDYPQDETFFIRIPVL